MPSWEFRVLRLRIRKAFDRWGLRGTGRGSDLPKRCHTCTHPPSRARRLAPHPPLDRHPSGNATSGRKTSGGSWGPSQLLPRSCSLPIPGNLLSLPLSPFPQMKRKQLRQLWSWDSR